MTLAQQFITIGLCALGTMATRFLPFLLFSPKKPTPKYVQYLGRALPCAVFGMLVVYCLRNVSVALPPHGVPEAIGIAVTVAPSPGGRCAICSWCNSFFEGEGL